MRRAHARVDGGGLRGRHVRGSRGTDPDLPRHRAAQAEDTIPPSAGAADGAVEAPGCHNHGLDGVEEEE
jgi:hypothetical protein